MAQDKNNIELFDSPNMEIRIIDKNTHIQRSFSIMTTLSADKMRDLIKEKITE